MSATETLDRSKSTRKRDAEATRAAILAAAKIAFRALGI